MGLSVLAGLMLLATPAAAQRKPAAPSVPDSADTYERCMDAAQQQPDQAYTAATRWRASGGGYAAEHCEATALLNLKRYDEAATRFHDVAEGATVDTAEATTALRIEAYDQAAQAWLTAEKPQNARAEYDAALKLAPKDLNLLLGRAQAEGLVHDYWAALDDLNTSLDIDPKRVDALVLRAVTYRKVESADLAMDDIARALALAPQFPDAYLERGTLKATKGDYDGARSDWNKVRDLAPGSFVAGLADQNLAMLKELSGTAAPAKPAKPTKPPTKP